MINGKQINDKSEIELISDKKEELKLGINNNESRMAKSVEAGIIFPLDFIIEKSANVSIYTDKEQQIVRYNIDMLHGNTKWFVADLPITALKKGEYKIKTFIKAENVESVYRYLLLKIS